MIEDRGLIFKSWKSYAKFLEIEVKKLQQLLTAEQVERAFVGAVKEAKAKHIRFQTVEWNVKEIFS